MKILMILGTGVILSFPMDKSVIPDCFTQGYEIMKKISTYREAGPNQGWILKDSNIEVGGWYCQ